MAKTREPKNALVTKEENKSVITFDQNLPSYLTGNEASGLEELGRDDYNIPQLKLIHPINPEVTQYQGIAIPGEYFHTALVKSLGNRVPIVVAVARKRVLVWRPRTDNGGGIIASSLDGINWDRGGNTKFTINIKGRKEPVIWDTKGNVLESGLKNFGSSNPDISDSAPAAVQYYEYVGYLPTHDGASPVVIRFAKTGIKAAKDMNAYFLLQRQRKVPIYSCVIDLTVGKKPSPEGGDFYFPMVEPNGFVPKAIYDITSQMHKDYANVELAIDQPVDNETHADKNSPDI